MQNYRIDRSYAWNYRQVPDPVSATIPAARRSCTLAGQPLESPLGIAAGPLLNGSWLLYYASLGFDWLTYKTVRSVARECYRLPNLQPVRCQPLSGRESAVRTSSRMTGSWAVSFGMPSQSPSVWRDDVRRTRDQLAARQRLSVSVVGTVQPGWTISDLADDYACCAKWAIESGADAVEANFSCPNVSTCDGQIYQQPASAHVIAARIRAAIGTAPLLVKVGHYRQRDVAAEFVERVGPVVDAIVTTNSIAAHVIDHRDRRLFGGQVRGICGDATRLESIAQTRCLAGLIRGQGADVQLVGVGGIRTAQHVRDYLAAGASAVQLATAPMVDPAVGIKIRAELASTPVIHANDC